MKERLVKGSNLVDVVRLIRAHREDRPLPALGSWEQDLLRKRVSASTWYSFQLFDSLLKVVHRYVFDGSEAAAQKMGRMAAREVLAQRPERLLVLGDPYASLEKMNAYWRSTFNFGEIRIAPLDEGEGAKGARIRLSGYPDMSACHGHVIMGWSREVSETAGAADTSVQVEERPWMHNSVLTYVLRWS